MGKSYRENVRYRNAKKPHGNFPVAFRHSQKSLLNRRECMYVNTDSFEKELLGKRNKKKEGKG